MANNHPIRVAYAEDHNLVREGVVVIINDFEGVQVDIEADNGKNLIAKIQKSQNIPDICILDVNMPEMNGFETLEVIKVKWPDMKVLILTVYDIESYLIRMILNGANGYLMKNCRPQEFKKAIFSIYNEGIYYSDTITRQFIHSIQNKEVKLPTLTAMELQVLKYSCQGDLSYVDIAQKMGTTSRSVEGYRDSLFKKFNTHSRVNLAMLAVQFGYVNLEINKCDSKKVISH